MGRVYERVGVMFFSLVFVMLGNQQNIPRIFQDRLLFYREKGAGVYGPVEYWWSIVVAQVRGWLCWRPAGVLRCVCACMLDRRNGAEPRRVFVGNPGSGCFSARAVIHANMPRVGLGMSVVALKATLNSRSRWGCTIFV